MKTLNLGMVSSSPAKLAIVSVLLLVGLLFVPNSWGQGDRGSISGTVTDSTGAVIPNVKIMLVQSATGVLFANTMTDGAGRYSFVNLPIGSYTMTFIAAGFREYDRKGITISVDQAATLNVALQVGAQTEVVTVTSDAELLDHDLATEATTMSASDIEELPLAIAGGGRNAMTFANMAVPTVGVGGLTPNYSVIVANSLGFSTNIMVDGVDADATMQGTQVPPGVDAVQQTRRRAGAASSTNSSPERTRFTAARSISVPMRPSIPIHGPTITFLLTVTRPAQVRAIIARATINRTIAVRRTATTITGSARAAPSGKSTRISSVPMSVTRKIRWRGTLTGIQSRPQQSWVGTSAPC